MKRVPVRRFLLAAGTAIFLGLVQRATAQAVAEAEQAEEILRLAGVRGGLIVHVPCGNGELTAALRVNDRFRVHGLDPDPARVTEARETILGRGLYGPVAVARLTGDTLPYAENLVNLVVTDEPRPELRNEILRILVPGGVAMVRREGGWQRTVRPPKPDLDEWPHFLRGPDNNAVSKDRTVGIPRSFRWVEEPRWGRSHEELASMSAAVASGGRLFAILDEAPLASIRFLADWQLVARDAFNGTLLWKRPVGPWVDHLRHFRAGPAHLPRRLVATPEAVYLTPSLSAAVVALDAATGETLREYPGTERTEEILFLDGVLYVVTGTSEQNRRGTGLAQRGEPEPVSARTVAAVNAKSGDVLWKVDVSAENVLPLTLAALGTRVYYRSTFGMHALDARTGREIWRTPRPTPERRMAFSAPTLVATPEVVLCADRDTGDSDETKPASGVLLWGVNGWNEGGFARKGPCTLRAYAAADGRELWSVPCAEGYNSPVDVFVVDSIAWVGTDFRGYDLKTGEEVRKLKTAAPKVGMPHHRCYRNKASERFIFTGKSGIEVLSLESGWLSNNSWLRGTCQYGIMPANGLLYAPPDACACYLTVKAPGLFAAGPQVGPSGRMPFPAEAVLEKGPAYGTDRSGRKTEPGDWPMYRHDPRRSGMASAPVPEFPAPRWTVPVGGRLTQPVVAGDMVCVVAIDKNTVYALDAETGRERWHYTAGGRVDSAPACLRGLVVFGCADGRVYALDAASGVPAWIFRAAPAERLVSAYGQLESAWPVHGAVLAQNGAIYATAGRSSYLDGGIALYRLDPDTGKQLNRTVLYHLDPDTGEQLVPEAGFNMEGTTSDVLSGDGERVFLKYFTFGAECNRLESDDDRLFSITGYLGEEWFVRSYWILGRKIGAGWGGWANAANAYAAGRILCFDDERVYGYGRQKVAGGPVGHRADTYHLFAADREGKGTRLDRKGKAAPAKPALLWADTGAPIARALVTDGKLMALAGPPDTGERADGVLEFRDDAAARDGFEGRKGVVLRVVRADTGKPISQCTLPAIPVFDGMSAAGGDLFLALRDGTVACFGPGTGTPLPDPPPALPDEKPAATPARADLPPLAGTRKDADFAVVSAAGIVQSELGYRLAARKGEVALALRETEAPFRKKVRLSVRLRRAPEYRHPQVYENAFLAFGDGTGDEDLVKCGIKFVVGAGVILTGTTAGQAALSETLDMDKDAATEIVVTVDFDARTVTMQACGRTLRTALPEGLTEITRVGYATVNAVSDFSTVALDGE